MPSRTGVRKASGALRSQLITQFLGEAIIYVALAMAVAVALSEVLLPRVNSVLKQRIAFDYLGDPVLLCSVLLTTVLLGLLLVHTRLLFYLPIGQRRC